MAVRGVQLGMMNQRIVLAVPTTSVDAGYGRNVTYTDEVEVWAYIKKKSGYRTLEANISGVETTKEFFVRHSTILDGIQKDWVIRYDSKLWVIQDIEKISEQRAMMKITATERENWIIESSS